MSLAYALPPPSGLGLSVGKSFFLDNTLRKKASVSPAREYLRKVAQQQPGVPAGTAPAAGPDIFDRFRDIWNFIRHGLTLLWYKKGAMAGTLSNDQWKSFQNAAQGLANNRTFKDVHGWWYGGNNKDAWGKYEGLPQASVNLQHLHNLKKHYEANGVAGVQGYYDRNKGLSSKGLQGTLDWAKKYGYMNEEDHKKYSSMLPWSDPNTFKGRVAGVYDKGKKVVNTINKWDLTGVTKMLFPGLGLLPLFGSNE